MTRTWLACAIAAVLPALASAQPAPPQLSDAQRAIACAPLPSTGAPPAVVQIIGPSEPVPRTTFGSDDQVVIAAGTRDGLALGQRFFIRRDLMQMADSAAAGMYVAAGHLIHTAGWLRIVAIDDTAAVGIIEHACSSVDIGDYLEKFQAPEVPAALTATDTLRDLDFSSPARVVFGDFQQISAGIGDFVLIDRGANAGVRAGTRFGIYRDLKMAKVPLSSVGEAVVVSESPDVAVVRIVRARDAVFSGDYMVPEKK